MNIILGCQHASSSANRLGSFDRKPSQWTMPVLVLLVLLCGITAAVQAQNAVYNGGITSTINSTFAGPMGVTTDSSGDIFVADNNSATNTATVYLMTYYAGAGYAAPRPLPGPAGGFPCPATVSESDPCLRGIVVDHNGFLWVTAFGDYPTPAGQVYVYSSGDAEPPISVETGTWKSPWGITADTLGNVFVTDNAAQTITKLGHGQAAQVYTYTGATNGIQQPRGIAVDSSADLFVIDGNAGQVKELPAPYTGIPNTVSPGFQGPGDLAIDANGNIWVSEFSTDLVGELAGWNATTSSFANVLSWGTGLNSPTSVFPDSATGNILVSDNGNHAIKQIALQPANFGSVAVGSTSTTAQTLTFTVNGTTTTFGAPVIVTQGATNGSDFVVGGSGNWTCTPNNGNTLCTVTVNFAPKAPGLRFGAVELQDTSNSVLATAPLFGTGAGQELVFNPGALTTTFTGLGSGHLTPEKIAVDSSGNVFIADNNGGIFEITAGTTAANHICCATSLSEPYGIAIDGAGNLFVTQSTGVYEILAPGHTTVQQLASGFSFSFPLGLAFDGNGNLYVADASAANKVDELTWASGYSNVITLSPSFGKPFGVAVDTNGNVWVADYGQSSVTELSPTGIVSHTYSGFNTPEAVAVDPAGNVYVADNGSATITELIAANSYASVTLASSASVPAIIYPAGVALDSAGNVYYTTNGTDDSAYKLNFASAPTLAFGSVPYQTASAQPVTVTNIGTTGSDLNLTALSATTSFTLGTSPGDCTAPSSLVSDTIGASCALSIAFTPQSTGSISGTATITDNAAGSPQIINLNGSGTQATATVAAANAAAAYSPSAQNVTLTATVTAAGPTVNEGTVAFTVVGTAGGTVTSPTVSGGTASVTYVIPAGQTTGNYTIQAVYNDAGGGFSSSTDITHTLSIGLATQATLTVTGMPVTAQTYQATFTVGSSGGSGAGAVTFAASGACSNTSGGALITMTSGTGTCSVTATKAADSTYSSATSTAATVTAQPAIAIVNSPPAASAITYGQMLSASTLTGGSATPSAGSFQWVTPTTVPLAGTQSESVIFVPTDTLDYSNSVPGAVNVTVNPASYIVTVSSDDSGAASNCTPQTAPGHGTDASCSLRDALLEAAATGGGNITFDATAFGTAKTITLANGALSIPSATTIAGATAGSGASLVNLVTVDGSGASTVFNVSSGVTGASVSNLTIQHGSSTTAGGIQNAGALTLTADSIANNTETGTDPCCGGGGISNSGTLTLSASTISGNTAASNGGGIENLGGLTLTGSTISGNTASGVGGGIANASGGVFTLTSSTISGNTAGGGGGLYNNGTLTLSDDTVTGNGASGPGGGIFNAATLVVSDSTLSANTTATASGGGGINNNGSGTVALANSVLSGNTSNSASDDFDGVAYTNSGGNIVGVASGTTVNGTAVNLAPLANYGGPTQTVIPLPGSPAICAGLASAIPSGLTTDQRGEPNTNTSYGFTPSPCVDAGAVQTNYALSFSTQPTGGPVATNFPAAVTLNESGSPFQPAVTIPLTLTGSGTLTGGSAATSGGVASYTLQVDTTGSSDILTANLALNPALVPAVAISAVSNTFGVGVTTQPVGLDMTSTSITVGTPETFYAYVPSAAGGTVTFYNNGSTALNSVPVPVSGGTATFSPSTLPIGSYTITAYYSGDSNYNPNTSSPQSLTVYPLPATMASPTPGPLTSASTTFTWNAASGSVTGYYLNIGTALGGADLINIGPLSGTSAIVNLPTSEATIYVRLSTVFNGTAEFSNDYTYTEAAQSGGAITGPTNGSPLSGASTTFNWSAGTGGVTGYYLHVGTTSGGADLVNIGPLSSTSTSAIVNLPTSGATIYAQLVTNFSGGATALSSINNYTEAAQSGGAITSPTNGSPLTGASATFDWSSGTGGVTGYYLHVGTTSGAADLVNIGPLVGTSATVTLPTNGATIYAQLVTNFSGGATALSSINNYTEAAQSAAVITGPVTGSFAFTTHTTVPTAGTDSESATFTPTDTTDYNPVTATFNVVASKATPTVTWPTASDITYGQTLTSSKLTGGGAVSGTANVPGTFAFATPTTAPAAGSQTESVIFTPTDASDYNTATGSVTLTVTLTLE